jgi:transposase
MAELSKEELLHELDRRDEEIARRDRQIEELGKQVENLMRENGLLRQKIDLLVRRIFGKSSEKLDPAQLELFMMGEDPLGKGEASWIEEALTQNREQRPKPRRRGRGRARWPEDLPVVEEVLQPQEVTVAPEQWRRIGEETTEQLDYEPGRFYRRRVVRPKYVSRTEVEAAPVVAPLPEMLQERCTAAPGLLAQIIVSKYCDHLPLYRQEQIYERRHGVWLPRQNQAVWMGLAADWLRPVYEHIKARALEGGYVQVDETPIEYLQPGHGKTKQGYLWTVCRPGVEVFYHWETSRAAQCLQNIIPVNFRGKLQCDGYAAYPAFARSRGEAIELTACLAHIRRALYEAREQAVQPVGFILKHIQNLYRIEDKLRKQRAGPALRQAMRQAQSRPIFQRLQKAILKLKGRYLPKSALGKAIDYALGQLPQLEAWLHDGRLEIDNNLVENAIRPTALGKKNWLFIGEADAGERGAILYTIIESCRRHGIDPFTYLRDVLARLPSMTNWQVKDITPEAWAKTQRSRNLARAA